MKKIVVTKRNFLIGFIVVTLVLAGVKRVAGIDANVNENASVNENAPFPSRTRPLVAFHPLPLNTIVFLTESILYIVSVRSRRSFLILMPCSLRLLRSMA